MKKLFILLVVLAISFSVIISGCAEPAPAPAPPTPAPTTPAPTTPAPTAPAPSTPAPTAPAPTTPAPTTPAPTTPAEPQPQYGGILTIRDSLPVDFVFGDPMNIVGPGTQRASVALQRLLLPGDIPGEYEYQLATGYKLAPDKSYYDISLRQGVTFHDGTKFDATAAKWNLDRVLGSGRAEFKTVTSFVVIDDYTLRMNLSEWTNRVLNDFMHDVGYMISPTAFVKNGGSDWAKLHPVGTGPFRFVQIRENQVLVFEKNPNYWEKGLPYLDRVEMHCIPDPVVTGLAMKSGEIDASWEGVDEETRKELEKDPDFRVWVSDGEFTTALYMNTIDPANPWYDPKVRQALEYAFNKEAVIEAVLSPYVYPLYNIIKGLEHSVTLGSAPRKYDPDKARELLAAAGYPDGLDFTWIVGTASWAGADRNAYLAWQAQLAEVGFRAEFEIIEPGAAREIALAPLPLNTVNTEMIRGNMSAPVEVVIEVLSEGGVYFGGVKRPDEMPALLDQALHAEDPAEALAILTELDKIAYDMAMFVPLQNHPLVPVVNSSIIHDFDSIREGLILARTWKSK